MFEPVSPKVDVQEVEKDQLTFWKDKDIFHRTMEEVITIFLRVPKNLLASI